MKSGRMPVVKQAVWLGLLGGVLLVLTNSAVWVNRYFFNTDNFANVTTTALTSESSRRAIAGTITDRAFENRPVLKTVAGDIPVYIVSGVLGTEQASRLIDTAVSRLQTRFTSNNPQPVTIDLSGLKNVLTQLYGVATNLGRQPSVDPNQIPGQITLFDQQDIPNFYRLGVIFLWLAPIAFIGALAALIYPYTRREQYGLIIAVQGLCITAAGLFALLVGPLFRPPLLANLKTPAAQTVAGNIYDAFILTFNAQTGIVIGLGVIMTLSGGGWLAYRNLKR